METVSICRDERGIATVRLERPEKHNAMSSQMISELAAAAARLSGDLGIRAVVLAAAGRSFCAGADLEWMRRQFDASREEKKREAVRLAAMLKAWNELPKPVIARVHGNAFGGGLGLIAVSDIAVAAEDAKYAFSETRLGLIPATISPYVAMRMGEANLRRVFMTGKVFSSVEASELNLVSKVVALAEIDDAVEAEVAPIHYCAPDAVSKAKKLARHLGQRIDERVIEETVDLLSECWEGEEAREGVAAFLEKRSPNWTISRSSTGA